MDGARRIGVQVLQHGPGPLSAVVDTCSTLFFVVYVKKSKAAYSRPPFTSATAAGLDAQKGLTIMMKKM